MSKLRQSLIPVLTLVFAWGVWTYLPLIAGLPDYFFPKVTDILKEVLGHTETASNTFITAKEALGGFLLGSLFGFIVGVVMAEVATVKKVILPYIIASNAIPVLALAPFFLLMFGSGYTSKIVIAAFLCFFPLCQNTYKSLLHYEKGFKNLFDVYGGTKMNFLLKYKLFNSLPSIFSGLRLNATYAVIGAVVAEFIGSTGGLGYGIIQATYNLNISRMWGYILLSCLLGLVFYGTVYLSEYLLLKKYKQ